MATIASHAKAAAQNTPDLSAYPLMDEKQVGVMRHMGNLARQPHNDWSFMLGHASMTEEPGAPRYQLGYMALALALTHAHRLPAAPGVFRKTMENLIEKIKLPDAWWEWRDVSKGGGSYNYDAPRSEGTVDPVTTDNIMYSAYLQIMPLLYNVLFNDDRYTQPGALTLKHRSVFWSIDDQHEFVYDQNTLNERIYWQMVENGNLGVACEPYCVFQFCNQPPILGFRLHDILNGGSTADEVTKGYLEAWGQFGGVLDENGHYNTLYSTWHKTVLPGFHIWSDAATGTLMNAWNSEFVQGNYPKQRDSWLLRGKDGALSVPLTTKAREDLWQGGFFGFGWLAAWASEMGDAETLDGLLLHADRHMDPSWYKNGFYYPRQDELYDEDGNLTAMTPIDGNVILGYARLNVKDGLRKFYRQPWPENHFEQPALDDVAFAIDVRRAIFDPQAETLIFDVRRSDGQKPGQILIARVFERGDWLLRRDGEVILSGTDDRIVSQDAADGGLQAIREGNGIRITISHSDYACYTLTWSGADR